jgi:PEP-CTERM motif
MKYFLKVVLAMGLIFSLKSHAVVIDLIANSHQVDIGSSLALQVRIAGLATAAAPSLGGYDMDLHYDPLLFEIVDIVWGDSIKGNQLDINGLGSLQLSNLSVAGLLNMVELSFDAPSDLEAQQADTFNLFSVVFSAIGKGTGVFSGNFHALSDGYGDSIFVDTINTLEVKTTSVPEPSGLLIMCIGLIALGLSRASKK